MALVDDRDEVVREVVEQGERCLARRSAVDVAGVVLDAVAEPELLHHLEVVLGAHPEPLGLEMMQEVGYCNGIENYAGPIDGRRHGEPPYTLLDYFPDDFLLVIDESHVAVPQLHGQFAGDRSRKDVLVEHGFRLPSARDNRPLTFEEVLERINQAVFLSAGVAERKTHWLIRSSTSSNVSGRLSRADGRRKP